MGERDVRNVEDSGSIPLTSTRFPAIAARRGNEQWRVYVVMSDGECDEGSVWEAAMFAAAQRLSRLCVIVDFNKWQVNT